MKPVVILKLGGSLITNKRSDKPEINTPVLRRLAREVGEAYKQIKSRNSLVIVHGAGSFGHPIVKRTGIHLGIEDKSQLIHMAETQRLQYMLNSRVTEELIKNGVPAFPFQASSSAIMKDGLKHISLKAMKGMIEMGIVPVSYGVPAYDINQGCSILSGDDIVPYLAEKLSASRVIHATDVDGVYDFDPRLNKKARLIRKIKGKIRKKLHVSGSKSTDVTGGMKKKLDKILSMKVTGMECQIINGMKEDNVKNVLLGKKVVGTHITY